MMRKVFSIVHLWLSVPFGLIITLVCFSGAMLVFEKELTELTHRDFYFTDVPEGTGPLPADSVAAIVAAALPEGVEVTGVSIFPDPERTWKVSLSEPRRASVHVDQFTGEILGREERGAFFTFMFRMHRWLLDSMKPGETVFWGKIIVGTSTLMFVPVLLSGLVMWWPRTARALKSRLKISVRKGWTRFLHDLHVAGGLYACIFLLAMALTGLTWSFKWYRTGFYKVFGAGAPAAGGHSPRQSSPAHSGDSTLPAAVWQKVYERLASENPDYARITVSDGEASVQHSGPGNSRASDTYRFNREDGSITSVSLYRDASSSAKLRGWIYSVHTGSWGGLVTRVLSFLAALTGAFLPLTGYWLWLRRILRRRQGPVRSLSGTA